MLGLRPVRELRADTRGANLVEYLIIIGLVAIVAIGGFKAFGKTATGKAEAQAACVESFNCGDKTAGGGTGPGGTKGVNPFAASLKSGQPPFDGVKGGKDAKYEVIKGTPFVQGPGDGNAVHPSDVSQGQLGDCYLMSSMAAIAQRNPDVIKNAITVNKDGTYTVTFYEKAPFWKVWDSSYHPTQVTVKPDFPARNGNPVFAQPGDGSGDNKELWPMIIEKAYAQKNGGYNSIGNGGTADGPMSLLTGKDSSMDGGRRYNDWFGWGMSFDTLADKWDKGEALTTGTKDSGDGPLFKNDTLVKSHEYYVTNVDRTNKTVTVRNPWGWGNGETTMTFDEYKQHFISLTSNPTR